MISHFFDMLFYAITGLFLLAAAVNLSGIATVKRAYRAWAYPRSFYRVVGAIQLTAGLFLAMPQTRIWGAILGGVVTFFTVVALLSHRRYGWSVPAMLLLAALAPATLAHG